MKIAASAAMTLTAVLEECRRRKGIDLVAVVDAASPGVQADMAALAAAGRLVPQPDGGLRYGDGPVLIPAVELEIGGEGRGPAHYVLYLPDLDAVGRVARHLAPRVTNLQLSSQRARLTALELLQLAEDHGGLLVPAHVFTPHKGFYGACADRLTEVFGSREAAIAGVELGLSADTAMADRVSELASKTFLSSSDAHSLARIAREYTVLELAAPSFAELVRALRREAGRRVRANYGLDPRLGKYYRSACLDCGRRAHGPPPARVCGRCGSRRLVMGVLDRLEEIADRAAPASPDHRPPYVHQVPLELVPGVGPRTLARLLDAWGSEMAVLHRAGRAELAELVGEAVADAIVRARSGRLAVEAGGGGTYGRVRREAPKTSG
ncbi:MAG: endonuclease Q family protein [Limnochordales bacterium]|nr:endonuclease Q family protein [Limnochordales bacterium]